MWRKPLLGRQSIARVQQLLEDFRRGQVALDTADAGSAEDAPHAAADLSRDAHGSAVGLFQENALDEIAVVEPEQEFLRAVAGNQVSLAAGPQRAEFLCHGLSKLSRKVGHLLEGGGSASDDPAMDLPGAHGGLSAGRKPGQ